MGCGNGLFRMVGGGGKLLRQGLKFADHIEGNVLLQVLIRQIAQCPPNQLIENFGAGEMQLSGEPFLFRLQMRLPILFFAFQVLASVGQQGVFLVFRLLANPLRMNGVIGQ